MRTGRGEVKYYRDRADLMNFFGVARTKWTVTRYGECVVATSSLGNQIWAKNVAEIGELLHDAGVDDRDIRFQV